jgi:hypothetical protein
MTQIILGSHLGICSPKADLAVIDIVVGICALDHDHE